MDDAPLKVLFLTRKWPPAVGGMEVYCREIVRALGVLADVEVQALPGRIDGRPPSLITLGWFGMRVTATLATRRSRFDVVHGADVAIWPLVWLAMLFCRSRRAVLSAHGTDIALAHRRGLRARLYALYVKAGVFCLPSVTVLANSAATGRLCEAIGFRRVSVVPLATVLRPLETADTQPYVLFVGRIRTDKGCGWFAREVLPKLAPSMRLVVAGVVWDDRERASLDDPRVELRPPVFGAELARLRARALAVVVPNLDRGGAAFEGFGLTATEGAADGGVVLAANVYGLADAVRDGETGFLLPPGRADAWAAKITEIAAWSDGDRRAFVARSREAVASHYSWERVAEETLVAYRQAPERPSMVDRGAAWLRRLRQRLVPYRERLRRTALLLALGGFVAGLGWALNGVADTGPRIEFVPLAILLLFGVPATIVLNAIEFCVMARAAGVRVAWSQSLEITVYGSAANMLPLPGGVIARMSGLRARGVGVKHGSWLIVLVAGIWAACACILSGAAITLHMRSLGAAIVCAGMVGLALCLLVLRHWGASKRLICWLVLIRVTSLMVETLRMMLAVRALGTALSFSGAATFAISSVAGTAVSLVPAGLGVHEAVVALLSPVIGVSPAIGFVAASIGRVASMLDLAILALAILLLAKRASRRANKPERGRLTTSRAAQR